MKIAIIGSGGVGGYFGGLLAKEGHDVYFLARGQHLEALQKNGLEVQSVNGDFLIKPVNASETILDIGYVDYAVIAVKDYHLESIIPQVIPLVGSETTVVPLLNGVDAHERLAKSIGSEKVVGGLCSLVSMVKEPGVIYQPSKLRRVVVGELNREPSSRVSNLIDAWKKSGADAVQPDDIFLAIWTKFIFIASFGGVSSLARANMGEILQTPETQELYIDSMREIETLARAQNIQLPDDIVDKTLKFSESFEPSATSSMQRDVMDGKPFELEAFSGKIVALGKLLEYPTPVHKSIDGLLRPMLKRAMN